VVLVCQALKKGARLLPLLGLQRGNARAILRFSAQELEKRYQAMLAAMKTAAVKASATVRL